MSFFFVYLCGPTVYNEPHIGNLRPIIIYDVVLRSLRKKYGEKNVKFIHNITDIDDKIIEKSLSSNKTEKQIASLFKNKYINILKKINVKKPNYMPLVTKNIKNIIKFIEKILENNHAYVIDGDVFFSIDSIKNYGMISGQKQNYVSHNKIENKKNPSDFVLWKKTNIGVTFNSPWGKGRPGWHTECATFVDKILKGESLDLHGGGIDLIFPHHENENIQYLAANNKIISKEWKHIGQLMINNNKMSKSEKNFITFSDFILNNDVDSLRYIFISTSATSPLNLNNEILFSANEIILKIKKLYYKSILNNNFFFPKRENYINEQIIDSIANFEFSYLLKEINELMKTLNRNFSFENANKFISIINLLGFSFANKKINLKIFLIYRKWLKLKTKKQFLLADKYRKKLIDYGII